VQVSKRKKRSLQREPTGPRKGRASYLFATLIALGVAVAIISSRDASKQEARAHSSHRTRPSDAGNGLSEEELETMSRAQEALRVLVLSHPSPEISQDLNRLITNHQVYLNFQDHAVGNEQNIAAARLIRTPQGLLLTLVISPSLLLDPDMSHEFKQLVVYHEYIHIRQQLNRTQPAWLLIGLRPDAATDEHLRIFINAEMEAYEAECRLAEHIGATDAFELCRVYSELGVRAMRIAFTESLAASPTYRNDAARVRRIGREL
jgi:hypothetical protein